MTFLCQFFFVLDVKESRVSGDDKSIVSGRSLSPLQAEECRIDQRQINTQKKNKKKVQHFTCDDIGPR